MSAYCQTFIKANGIRLHVAEQGDGPLVLLCHGFPETSHAWRHQLGALARAGFHAIAPDLRGYGLSECPTAFGQYTTLDVVGDLVALVDVLGERDAVVVGNDWGATIAWQAALLRPDRFRAVAALGAEDRDRVADDAEPAFSEDRPNAVLYALLFRTWVGRNRT